LIKKNQNGLQAAPAAYIHALLLRLQGAGRIANEALDEIDDVRLSRAGFQTLPVPSQQTTRFSVLEWA
jgi:hypothetical protein